MIMTASDLINPLIPPLKASDSVQKALDWMSQFRIHQLPLVEQQAYKGLISEEVLYDLNKPTAKISDLLPDYQDVYVTENQHFYDVIKATDKNHLPLIAVLDEEKKFRGVITIKDTINAFARTFATQSSGAILVISMREYDYSMAEISRLIEENHLKILSSYLEADAYDPTMVKLTLKLDKADVARAVATLERFEYNVIAKFQETEVPNLDKDRLDMLFKYLNI
jgi:acetoin utilization protein AcuB